MAFLFQDQNQGTRNEAATRESAAAATVLFHPDYNRRLRIHTESADPSSLVSPKRKALAGLGCFTLTAGGDFHPALRTSSRRNDGSSKLCRVASGPASTFGPGNP